MLIGKRINDRYKVSKLIGDGGMANVFLAHDMILNRNVAVKILRTDLAGENNFIRRFQREAQSATTLVHPNIVSIYDVGEQADLYYIVMEYVEGMDLKQYIQKNAPISFEKTVDIMLQIVSAAKVAHGHHIIHRDLKPQNILIDHDGNVKITDFGIAMALSKTSITQTNSVVGSVHYLSPEQARGGMATQKSDIYSLGIVLYELLTGKVPYDGESAVSIAIKHLQTAIPSVRSQNPKIPQSLENIIIRATAKDPFMRYQSAEDMEQDLHTCLKEERLNEPKYITPARETDTKAIPLVEAKNINQESKKNDSLQTNAIKEKKTSGSKTKKKKVFWVTFSVVLLFAAILLGLWFLGKSPKEIEIPDVVGKTETQAVSALQKQGFTMGRVIEQNSDTVKEGEVIETNPKAGELKETGTKVDLYVSIGSKKVTMENFVGRSYSETKKLLKERGFNTVEKTEKYSNTVSKGVIISQSPDAGESLVAKETNVEFVVSKGPEPIKLKELKGYNKRALDDYAESIGITIQVKEENSESVEKGQVIRQIPESGATISRGATVNVVISSGPKEKEVKKITKTFDIKYNSEEKSGEENKPQHVQVYIEDKNHSMTAAFKEMDITKDTKVMVTFEIEEDSQGGYKIIVDNTIVDEGTVS